MTCQCHVQKMSACLQGCTGLHKAAGIYSEDNAEDVVKFLVSKGACVHATGQCK